MSWFFACWLWCNNFLLDQHCTFYFWLLNANLLQLYLYWLVPWRQLEGSYEIGSVHSSLLTSVCMFSWNLIIDFSRFCEGARNPYEVVYDNPILFENFFWPQKWGNGAKIGFLNLKKNFVINFYWICSIMNIFIICCVLAQILCLGKILFLRCRPRYSQLIKLHNF